MKLSAATCLPPEQIRAEIAEMRKAARAIAASPRKRLEFLRQVGVLNSSDQHGQARQPVVAAARAR